MFWTIALAVTFGPILILLAIVCGVGALYLLARILTSKTFWGL